MADENSDLSVEEEELKEVEDSEGHLEKEERVGVVIHRSHGNLAGYFPRRPAVCARIVDNGQTVGEPVASKEYDLIGRRSTCPNWEELLVFEERMSKLHKNQMLMFDLTDVTQGKNRTWQRVRVAWAFLKPVASDDSSNTNKEARLQLYKPRKSCKISHQNCEVFHLYSAHDWKKFPGSLFVTVKGVKYNLRKPGEPELVHQENVETDSPLEEKTEVELRAETASSPPRWTRLPSQTCKVPNKKQKDFNVGSKGASSLAFSRKGVYLAIATLEKIFIYSVLSLEEFVVFFGHNGLIYDLDWSDDDKALLSASADGTTVVWGVVPLVKTPLFVLPHPSFVYCGKWLGAERLATGCKDHVIRYWCKVGNRFELTEEMSGHEGFVSALATQGDCIVSGDSLGCVVVRRLVDASWEVVKKLTLREFGRNVVDALHFHAGSKRVVVTCRSRGSFLLDLSAGVVLQAYRAVVNACARCVSCLTPCGSFVLSHCQNSVINVWEVNTGKCVATYEALFPVSGRTAEVAGAVAFHPLEHMAAFSVLGQSYPVMLLKYNAANDDSKKLGLIFRKYKHDDVTTRSKGSGVKQTNSKESKKPTLPTEKLETDKLASLVRKIDKVFAAKKALRNKENGDME